MIGDPIWTDWARLGAMVAAVVAYTYACYLSFQARAVWSVFVWGLCILIATSYAIIYGLYLTDLLTSVEFAIRIRPFLFPSNMVLWLLPALDWIWRLRQANEAGIDTTRIK